MGRPDTGRLWYRFIRVIAAMIFRLIGGPRVLHRERMPLSGPVLVAPNHLSYFDPPLVAVATRRALSFMAKEELFRGILGLLIRSLEAFPVRRGEGDTEAIKEVVRRLGEGKAVLLFPEGTRGFGEELSPISAGIGMFAKRTGALVVPVGIIGTEKAWGKGQKIRRAPLTVVIGEPFRYADVANSENERENRATFARVLGQRLAEACAEGGLPVQVHPTNRTQ